MLKGAEHSVTLSGLRGRSTCNVEWEPRKLLPLGGDLGESFTFHSPQLSKRQLSQAYKHILRTWEPSHVVRWWWSNFLWGHFREEMGGYVHTLYSKEKVSFPFCLPSDAEVLPTMHLSQCLARMRLVGALLPLSFFLAFCRSLHMLGPSFGVLWFSTLAVECLFLLSVFQKLKPEKWESLRGKQNKTQWLPCSVNIGLIYWMSLRKLERSDIYSCCFKDYIGGPLFPPRQWCVSLGSWPLK